jgi:hypothetical protein
VKKSIAAGGAGVLGLTAAVGGAAGPAMAAPVSGPACDDIADHQFGASPIADWYMDCVPQYAATEVDFTITSDVPFPSGFATLDDPSVTRTGLDFGDYVGTDSGIGIADLTYDGPDGAGQRYVGRIVNRITSIETIDPSTLPAACMGDAYANAWMVSYAPATTTFTQLVDGVEWRYDVVSSPEPLYLGLNPGASGAACAANGSGSVYGADPFDFEWLVVTEGYATTEGGVSLMPYFGEGKSLPDVSRYTPPAPQPEPEKPALAATGVSPELPLGAAAILLGLGAGALAVARRRRVTR